MALTTVANIKTIFGITGSASDDLLALLLTYADAAIKTYVGNDIESTTYPGAASNGNGDYGIYNGNNQRYLVLRQRPVTAVSSIYLDHTGRFGDNPDGAYAASTLLVNGTDYVVHWDGCLPGTSTKCSYKAIVEKINGVWPATRQWVSGQITPLYMETPGNVKVAYTAGYTTVPPDLAGACVSLVAFMRKNMPKGVQLSGETQGAYNWTAMASNAMAAPEMGTTRQLLSRYRDLRLP